MWNFIKRYALTLFVFALLLFSNFYTLNYEGDVSREALEIVRTMLPSVYHVSSMSTDVSDYQIHELRHLLAEDSLDMVRQETAMQAEEKSYSEHEKAYLELMVSDRERILFEQTKAIHERYLAISREMIRYSRAGRKGDAYAIFRNRLLPLDDTLTARFDTLVSVAMRSASQMADMATEATNSSRLISVIVIASCAVAVLSWIIGIEYFERAQSRV
ncbi:MAG: MCP four helix bundle domain-containing protein [Chloroherpetonaceae bacterium]|nr:MCP four helix bundle domain-containing protein [Chloroherpetonaceae bacterium]MCS7212073.1 MCP four helix bundle domain-containing protein [Chloroherpetonaceae bacterium]MDW8018910.1 MCP four helix bundle domain-containing protein [Chloroherpetonaceae bacterium]